MDGVLSQEEINALLNNNDAADSSDEILTESEKDAIGEIANISMGTAATTLFSLVNRRVEISTPVVSFSNWDKMVDEYEKPCVFIKIGYTQGLNGSNILVLKEKDILISKAHDDISIHTMLFKPLNLWIYRSCTKTSCDKYDVLFLCLLKVILLTKL